MRRAILGLAVVAAVLLVILVVRDPSSGLDLEAISNCETPLVHEPPRHREAAFTAPVTLEPVTDLENTIAMDRWPDGRLVIAIRTGEVVLLDEATGEMEEILDISDRIVLNDEGGVLGLTVDPDGRHLYLHHTDREGTSHVLSFPIDGDRLVETRERELLRQPHPGLVHNGGQLAFGPDDLLYVGFGDGSLVVDDAFASEDRDDFAAKILRIDPTPDAEDPYVVPDDNPDTVGADGRPEIFVTGVRNPWRFSFDSTTGDLWIGDVGNDCWEEINLLRGGGADSDLGWPRYEGNHALSEDVDDGNSVWPVLEIRHGDGCAVIGGFVYRGADIPELDGRYVYGDLCEDALRWLEVNPDGTTTGGLLGVDQRLTIGFWADEDGELYALSATEGIGRLGPG